MNHLDKISLFPESIYRTDEYSVTYRLWKLFSHQLNEYESKIINFYDLSKLEGVLLDKAGELFGLVRLPNQSDSDFRDFFSFGSNFDLNSSLSTLHSVIRKFTTNYNIIELPYNRDTHEHEFSLNGDLDLDGREPADPYYRAASILILSNSVFSPLEFQNMKNAIDKIRHPATKIYYFIGETYYV